MKRVRSFRMLPWRSTELPRAKKRRPNSSHLKLNKIKIAKVWVMVSYSFFFPSLLPPEGKRETTKEKKKGPDVEGSHDPGNSAGSSLLKKKKKRASCCMTCNPNSQPPTRPHNASMHQWSSRGSAALRYLNILRHPGRPMVSPLSRLSLGDVEGMMSQRQRQ